MINDPMFINDWHLVASFTQQQYKTALHNLNTLMQSPERTRDAIRNQTNKVQTSGSPTLEHLPALMALECTTREAGGSGYARVEEMVFTEIARLMRSTKLAQHENEVQQLLTFFEGAFRYKRKYDTFATYRRNTCLKLATQIAVRTQNPQAFAFMHDALTYPVAKIRSESIAVIYWAYRDDASEIPADIIARFKEMRKTDRAKDVRKTARVVLQELGLGNENRGLETM